MESGVPLRPATVPPHTFRPTTRVRSRHFLVSAATFLLLGFAAYPIEVFDVDSSYAEELVSVNLNVIAQHIEAFHEQLQPVSTLVEEIDLDQHAGRAQLSVTDSSVDVVRLHRIILPRQPAMTVGQSDRADSEPHRRS